jgi:hypothetical protein
MRSGRPHANDGDSGHGPKCPPEECPRSLVALHCHIGWQLAPFVSACRDSTNLALGKEARSDADEDGRTRRSRRGRG